VGCIQRHLHGVPVQRDEPGHRLGVALHEVARASDVQEQLGCARARLRIEQSGQREHDVVRGELAPWWNFTFFLRLKVHVRPSREPRQNSASDGLTATVASNCTSPSKI